VQKAERFREGAKLPATLNHFGLRFYVRA